MSETTVRQRVGIYGGSFDPIHFGHLLIAELVRERLNLDEIRFVPAAVSPLKLNQQPTDAKHRVDMIRLAIGGNVHFKLDERELQRGGPSFTVDTLAEIKAESPSSDLFFLMGADSLADFHAWREPQRICELAFVAIVARGGHATPDLAKIQTYLPKDQAKQAAEHLVQVPQFEISSTEIRERVRHAMSIRYQVPAAVEVYIESAKLYR